MIHYIIQHNYYIHTGGLYVILHIKCPLFNTPVAHFGQESCCNPQTWATESAFHLLCPKGPQQCSFCITLPVPRWAVMLYIYIYIYIIYIYIRYIYIYIYICIAVSLHPAFSNWPARPFERRGSGCLTNQLRIILLFRHKNVVRKPRSEQRRTKCRDSTVYVHNLHFARESRRQSAARRFLLRSCLLGRLGCCGSTSGLIFIYLSINISINISLSLYIYINVYLMFTI